MALARCSPGKANLTSPPSKYPSRLITLTSIFHADRVFGRVVIKKSAPDLGE
jgi:hypothetical protein